MKRVFLITGSVLLTILVSGMLNRETRAVQAADMTIRKQTREITEDLVRVETEKTALREAAAESRRQTAHDESGMQFDPKFVDWLLAGNYAEVPRDLVPVLRAALGFPWNDSPDAVLISKAALRDLTLRGPVRNDKLSPAVCAVLSITPDEQVQLESAMAQSRGQYLDWARSNLQREGASTNGLLKYTIPAALELSVHLTNQLYAAFQNAVGAQRTELLNGYTSDWLQFDAGTLGAITISLRVFQKPGADGKPELYYEVKRSRSAQYGESGESGRLVPAHLHPSLRDLFPGGWAEIFEHEGLELPKLPDRNQ
jgi:hypothetical protein